MGGDTQRLRELLTMFPDLLGDQGRVQHHVERAWLDLIANKRAGEAELMAIRVDQFREELRRPNAGVDERLLVDEVVQFWLQTQVLEILEARRAMKFESAQVEAVARQRREDAWTRYHAALDRLRTVQGTASMPATAASPPATRRTKPVPPAGVVAFPGRLDGNAVDRPTPRRSLAAG